MQFSSIKNYTPCAIIRRNLCFLISKLAEFRVRWDVTFFLCHSQSFQNEALMDAETLLHGWRIVLVGGQGITFIVEVSLVFGMKPANTKASHSVNTYTFLACISLRCCFFTVHVFSLLCMPLGFFILKRRLTPEWKQCYLSNILVFVFTSVP